MIKTLLGYVKQYKRDTLLTPLFSALEVFQSDFCSHSESTRSIAKVMSAPHGHSQQMSLF